MISDPSHFGALLKTRRRKLGISQQDLADVVGVNRRVIGELERGKKTVQLEIALNIARALGLDIDFKERN